MEKIYDLKDNSYFYNNEIESFEYREIKNENRDQNNPHENATYNFFINDTSANILYSDGYLQQELKIVKQNGNVISDENVTLVNGGGLINSNRLIIGNTEIESTINYKAIMNQVLGLIHFTPDYSTSEATNMFFYADTADSADRKNFKYSGTLTDATKLTDFFNNLRLNEGFNEGFSKRCKFTKDSQTVKIWIPLKYIFDFFNEYKKVMTGFQVKIEIQRNDSKNMLYTDIQNPEFKVIVENLSLWLPYVKFKNSAAIKFNELKLSDRPIEINWDHYNIIKSNVFFKNASGSCTIPATSDEVLSLYVIPQYNERNENMNKNNLMFDHLDMMECWLMINNVKVPTVSYTMDFNKNDFNRLYTAMLDAGMNNITAETGCMINYSNFSQYPIICFNLANHENYTNLSNLMIEFNWRLRNNTNKDYIFYFILKERNKCFMNMKTKEITMIKTLKT